MSKLNISQAARAVGVARITIQRHLKQGKLSFDTTDWQGHKLIDTSELTRVYGEIKTDGAPSTEIRTSDTLHDDTPDTEQLVTPMSQPVAPHSEEMLQQKVLRIKDLEDQVAEFKISIQDLRDDREERKAREVKLLGIVEKQTHMLSAPEHNSTVWSRLKGFFADA